MRKFEQRARKRIEEGLNHFIPVVREIAARGATEADTRAVVRDMLQDILGYDKFREVTGEFMTRGHYADFGLRVEDAVRCFVEVKAIGSTLREKDVFQVLAYAASEGVEWAILTDGDTWHCYHLIPGSADLVFSVSLTDAETDVAEKVERFYLLSKESLWQGLLAATWEEQRALAPASLTAALLSKAVLQEMRREIRRSSDRLFDLQRIEEAIRRGVIKPSVLEDLPQPVAVTPRRRKAAGVTPRTKGGLGAGCFAYMGDPDDPSTWKLPYRKADGTPDEAHLRAAVAALSPGGHRGRRVEIPPEASPHVKARLQAAYQELGYTEDQTPPGLRD